MCLCNRRANCWLGAAGGWGRELCTWVSMPRGRERTHVPVSEAFDMDSVWPSPYPTTWNYGCPHNTSVWILKGTSPFLVQCTAPGWGPPLGKWGMGRISVPARCPWPGVRVQSTPHTMYLGTVSRTGGNRSLAPGHSYSLLTTLLFKCFLQGPERSFFTLQRTAPYFCLNLLPL